MFGMGWGIHVCLCLVWVGICMFACHCYGLEYVHGTDICIVTIYMRASCSASVN